MGIEDFMAYKMQTTFDFTSDYGTVIDKDGIVFKIINLAVLS
jgi:hypothetical protein